MSTIAVLVLGLCLWLWPRVDQRLVGKWFGWEPAIPPYYQTLELRQDGTGTASGFEVTSPVRWWVRDEKLFLTLMPVNPRLLDRMWLITKALSGESVVTFTISRMEDWQINLRRLDCKEDDPFFELALTPVSE